VDFDVKRKTYYQTNREKIKKRSLAYYYRHREEILARYKEIRRKAKAMERLIEKVKT
jgi:hypothetical protein